MAARYGSIAATAGQLLGGEQFTCPREETNPLKGHLEMSNSIIISISIH